MLPRDFIRPTKCEVLEASVQFISCYSVEGRGGRVGAPAELFQILKDDAVKSAELNIPANLVNLAMAAGLEKVSFHSIPKERQYQRMFKLSHYCTNLTY